MMRFRYLATAGALALALAACGGLNEAADGDGGAGGTGISHPAGPDDLVLRVAYEGGFVPVEYALKRVPGWSLYGDGTVIVEGPTIEIYPAPALPNLIRFRLSEDGVQAVLQAARDAGLMDGDASYDYPCITDVPTTVFTTTADGRTSVVSAYALGDADAGSCPGVDASARAALFAFQGKLGDLASWLPAGSIGAEEPYVADEVRIHVFPYTGRPDLPQEPIDWPLATGLDAFGDETSNDAGVSRCGAVSGSDLETLRPLMGGANEITPWVSDGAEHRLVLRPLLPDEHGC